MHLVTRPIKAVVQADSMVAAVKTIAMAVRVAEEAMIKTTATAVKVEAATEDKTTTSVRLVAIATEEMPEETMDEMTAATMVLTSNSRVTLPTVRPVDDLKAEAETSTRMAY